MTIQVTIMFGLGFMSFMEAILNFVRLFYYDSFVAYVFSAAILNYNF